jgi:hypothetical protein
MGYQRDMRIEKQAHVPERPARIVPAKEAKP